MHGVGFARCNRLEVQCGKQFLQLESGNRIDQSQWLKWCARSKLPMLFEAERILLQIRTAMKSGKNTEEINDQLSVPQAELLIQLIKCSMLTDFFPNTKFESHHEVSCCKQRVLLALNEDCLTHWTPTTEKLEETIQHLEDSLEQSVTIEEIPFASDDSLEDSIVKNNETSTANASSKKVYHRKKQGACHFITKRLHEITHGSQGQEHWKQNTVFDPFHPAGRRTLEWLIRETSAGRQLRAVTMLVTLMIFVMCHWVALLNVTEAQFSDSALPALIFAMGCGLKIAKRMPSYLDSRMFAFLRTTGCLTIRVEDRMDTAVMSDRDILNEELDKLPALASNVIRWPGFGDWFVQNYDWYGFLIAVMSVFCAIHPLKVLFDDHPNVDKPEWQAKLAFGLIALIAFAPMLVWLIVRYFIIDRRSRRKFTIILYTAKTRLGSTFCALYLIVFLTYMAAYPFLDIVNDLNAFNEASMCTVTN